MGSGHQWGPSLWFQPLWSLLALSLFPMGLFVEEAPDPSRRSPWPLPGADEAAAFASLAQPW